MNVPIPPSDSLYKFCSLAGIFVTAVSLYFPTTLVEQLTQKSEDITLEIATVNVDVDFAKHRVGELAKLIDNSIANQKGQKPPDPNKLELHYSEDEVKGLIRELEELNRSNDKNIVKLDQLKANLIRIIKDAKTIFLYMIGCIIFGLALTIYGFYNWYYKIQVFQDKLLFEEAHKKRVDD